MKYTVVINQLAFQRHFPELDIIDAAIFDYISQFMLSKHIEVLDDGSGRWYWVSYKKIADDMPIINIKKDAIYRRVKKLVAAGLLKKHSSNSERNRSYFAQGDKFDLINFTPPDEKPNPRFENRGTPGAGTEGPPDEKPADTIINDTNINDEVYTPDIFTPEQEQPKKHPLVVHIERNYKRVAKMENPLTSDQAKKLIKDYLEKYPQFFPTYKEFKLVIDDLLKALNNNKAVKKNINANETIRNWLNRRLKWKEEDQNAQEKNTNKALNNALSAVDRLDFD